MNDMLIVANKIAEEKENIRRAIEKRGVEIPVSTPLTDYAAKIASIDTQNQASEIYYKDNNFDEDATEFTVPGDCGVVADYALASKTNLERVDLNNTTAVLNGAFKGCKNLKEITTNKLKHTGVSSFSDCGFENLSNDTITRVGANSFTQNNQLLSVEFSEAKTIEAGAFAENPTLESIKINKCEYLGAHAFNNNVNLTSIEAENVEEIGENCFQACGSSAFTTYSRKMDVNLPKVKYLADKNFYNSWGVQNIDMPECEFIGDSCFYLDSNSTSQLQNLETIHLPKVKHLSNNCFSGSSTSYGYGAFGDINLPECSSIGNYCFAKPSISPNGNRTLTISDKGCSIGEKCFYRNSYNNIIQGTPTKIVGKLISVGKHSFDYYSTSSSEPIVLDIDFSNLQYLTGTYETSSTPVFYLGYTGNSGWGLNCYNFVGGMIDFSSFIDGRYEDYRTATSTSSFIRLFDGYGGTRGHHNVTKIWVPDTCQAIYCGLAGRSATSPIHIYTDATEGKNTWYFGGTVSTDSKLTTGSASPYIVMHFGTTHEDFVNAIHE